MKTYEVELKRESYITIWVDAESQDEAEEKAWKEVEDLPDSNDASWAIESIEEINQGE
jgi:hypothetical protein